MKLKKTIVVLLLVTMMLLAAGCRDKTEMGDLAIVLGMGLDWVEDASLMLTIEVSNRKDPGEQGSSMTYSVSADTFEQAEEKLAKLVDKQLFWGNLTLLLFGGTFSDEQILRYATSVYQDDKFGVSLVVLRTEKRAKDVLQGSFGSADYVSLGLPEALELQERQYSLADYLEDSMKNNSAAEKIPVVNVDKQGIIILEEQ